MTDVPKIKYTAEHIDYIREISPGRYSHDITIMFNERFGTDITEAQMRSVKSRNKIRSNLKKKRRTPHKKLFNKVQEAFLKENAIGITNQELADRVNDVFGLSITSRQITSWKKNNDVQSGLKCQFKKGQAPANKGLKQSDYMTKEQIEKSKATRFKKGDVAKNYKPIGTEVLTKDGYIRVKVQDNGRWDERWKLKHTVLWERENGPVPEGKVLTFLDGDKRNAVLDNLMLVTRAEHLMMTRRKLRFGDPELTKVGAAIAKISNKTIEISKNRKDASG